MGAARAGLIVEFVGIPGVGKSTLARRTHELLTLAGVPGLLHAHPTAPRAAPGNRIAKALSYVRYAPPFARLGARHPTALLHAAIGIRATRQRSTFEYVKVFHNLCRTTLLVERCRGRPGVHLVDQGTLQALWAVAFSAGVPDALTPGRARHMLAALPDVVVVVTADADDIRKRLSHRAVAIGRLEQRLGDDPSVLEDAVAAFRSVEGLLGTLARDEPPLRLLRVDNAGAGDVEARARFIAEQLPVAGRG